ncbi:hypothetical protein Daus18300_014093 [Diaporthe australafricana]|uniref:ABC-type Fe3+ transport system n=1 Tax=Diaporthe australafricana TaxID=127596 RepID=A0ABR3VWH8_9PEZI
MARLLLALTLMGSQTLVNAVAQVENRTLDEIHKAALAEGGMTLNLTVDLSKYHDTRVNEQIAANDVYVDSIIIQTLHNFPRWASEDALLEYAPLGFDKIHPEFKSNETATYYGLLILAWAGMWNSQKLPGIEAPVEWEDWLRPEFKDKLVLTYPNDDDAVLFAFALIEEQYGASWLDKLIAQNPRWVRGTGTPLTLMAGNGTQSAATFTSVGEFDPAAPLNVSHPVEGQFVSWPQTGAILKDSPHPEGAKLLHSYMLSNEYETIRGGWGVRSDSPQPAGFPQILDMPGTDPTAFGKWMADRAEVERQRVYYEMRLGVPVGLSPLVDDI